jgi:hypothetical protein
VRGVAGGTATITVTSSGGQTASTVVTVNEGVGGVLVTLSPVSPIASGATTTVTAQLTDVFGNPVNVVRRVNWNITDPTGTLTSTTALTDAAGRTTTTYQAGTIGTWTITATEPVTPLSASAQVTVSAAASPSARNVTTLSREP